MPSSSGASGGGPAICAMGRPSCCEQVALREIAHVDQDFADLLAFALALEFEGAVEVFGGNETAVD